MVSLLTLRRSRIRLRRTFSRLALRWLSWVLCTWILTTCVRVRLLNARTIGAPRWLTLRSCLFSKVSSTVAGLFVVRFITRALMRTTVCRCATSCTRMLRPAWVRLLLLNWVRILARTTRRPCWNIAVLVPALRTMRLRLRTAWNGPLWVP